MPTLGSELKHRREEQGITLAHISDATRIGTRFLKAIDEDNFSVLPGGLFTRSFIRAYAKQIGMNEEEAVSLYHQQIAPPPEESAETQPASPSRPELVSSITNPSERPTARARWLTIAVAASALVVISIVVVALLRRLNREGSASPSTSTQTAVKAPSTAKIQPVASSPARAPEQAAPISISASPDQNDVRKIVIKVEATTGDSWIRYQIDDNKSAAMMLKAGLSQDLPPAEKQIRLNIGNRNTLKLSINNRIATFPPGTPNFAAQVTVSRDNLQT